MLLGASSITQQSEPHDLPIELQIEHEHISMVGDTLADPRWRHHPRVQGAPPVRFLLSYPLIARDGLLARVQHLGAYLQQRLNSGQGAISITVSDRDVEQQLVELLAEGIGRHNALLQGWLPHPQQG